MGAWSCQTRVWHARVPRCPLNLQLPEAVTAAAPEDHLVGCLSAVSCGRKTGVASPIRKGENLGERSAGRLPSKPLFPAAVGAAQRVLGTKLFSRGCPGSPGSSAGVRFGSVRRVQVVLGSLGAPRSETRQSKLPRRAAPLRVLQCPALVAPQGGLKSQGSGVLQLIGTAAAAPTCPDTS